MKARIVSAFLAAAVVAGCEQTSQDLPFTVDDVVEQTIAVTGGTVSTPAGASVQFPSGSVAGPVQVTLQVSAPAAGTTSSGTSVSETFRLEPAGLALSQAATAELKFSAASDRSRAWLASMISVANGKVREYGDTRVEIGTGLAATQISQLGSLSVVIPPSDAVVRVTRASRARANLVPLLSGSAALATSSDSVVVRCGDPNDRCAGVTATATDNVMDMVEDAAAVYPAISGRLRLRAPSVADSIVLNTSVRALLSSGQSAENVVVHAVLRPTAATTVTETASEIRLSNVFFRVSGDASSGSGAREEVDALVITRTVSGGSITLTRNFFLGHRSTTIEPATITITFPVEVYP